MSIEKTGDQFEKLFKFAPISLWEEDFSGIRKFFDGLQVEGITDLEDYLNTYPEEID